MPKNHFYLEDDLANIFSAQVAVAISRALLLEEREKTREGLFASAHSIAAGQISTGFLHETKNSLNAIAVTLENVSHAINKDFHAKTKKKLLNKIESIEEEITRIYELSQRVQKYGARFSPHKSDHYINEIVLRALEIVNSELKKKKIKVVSNLDLALDNPNIGKGNTFKADKSQIEQVLVNILLNAIDSSRERSQIVIASKLRNNSAVLSVKDHGKGIEPKNKPEIFKPFFTTKPEGVGLGLYICKIIIEDNHKGSIELKTEIGKGTTFTVLIPKL